ncbi:MAG: prepilin peptidase [Anaerococcus vaginalis]|uniref:prepilin peptidase n=1 Tax=Peptoniphilaceae TaxID=1570339 RepID=UPI00290012DB|nr:MULTISPECIES: prepilin peptidase [Peptoniphilaceae]MDU1643137.1 prepilin peptidase [Peptoniphilus harei]MDU1764243.1 prepilin peptidase [Anaerococcus vaginalis]
MKVNLYYIFISLLVFLFGGSLGSFYKVFVERRERGEDFIFSQSHCDSCKKTLKFYEMIPVFSYIFLRGKCSSCGEKIERENFYLEVLTSLLALLVFMRYKISIETLIVIFILIIAFFIGIIDYKTGYIYNLDLIILLFFVVLYKIFVLGGLIDSLKYSLGMGLIFFLIYFVTKMMGLGDVYYSLIMGLLANDLYEAFVLFRDSFISAGFISLILILLKKKTFKDSISFGPFMTVAIIIFLICR